MQVAERTEVERRNYEFRRGGDTIGGNKIIDLKAEKVPSSVEVC